MVKLFNWTNKEVEVTLKSGRKVKGFVWRYYRDSNVMRDGDYEYYIGYDGGMMEQVKPSEVKEIKEIHEYASENSRRFTR